VNWLVFAVFAWLALGLETGLKDALQLGSSGVAPSFVMTLLAFVAASSTRSAALWAAASVGAALDLLNAQPVPGGVDEVVVFGPYTLGCMLAAYATVTTRPLVFRRSTIALAFLTFVFAAMAAVVVTALLAVRSWYDPTIEIAAGRELLLRLGAALYSAGLALLLGPALGFLAPLFGFPQGSSRERRWRA